MKIYTKKGDAGETSLYGNVRVPKDALRIQTYGTIDELNASLGLALAEAELLPIPSRPGSLPNRSLITARLKRIQSELFQLGAELATPPGKTVATALIGGSEINALEDEIDQMETCLSPLKTFILPGGTRLSSLLHLSRTISRRAERELTALNRSEPCRADTLRYANRLSDFLFVLARFANHLVDVQDIPWVAPRA